MNVAGFEITHLKSSENVDPKEKSFHCKPKTKTLR